MEETIVNVMKETNEGTEQVQSKETKTCTRCHRTLAVSEFCKSSRNKDGLQHWCTECQRESYNERQERKRASKTETTTFGGRPMVRVYSHPDLARFTPRQLMEELKARGFVWEYMLEPQHKILFSKI